MAIVVTGRDHHGRATERHDFGEISETRRNRVRRFVTTKLPHVLKTDGKCDAAARPLFAHFFQADAVDAPQKK